MVSLGRNNYVDDNSNSKQNLSIKHSACERPYIKGRCTPIHCVCDLDNPYSRY